MAALPVVSGDEFCRVMRLAVGYSIARQKGSHMRLHATGRTPLSVPRHRELRAGLFRKLLAQAGVSVDQFVEAQQR